MVRIERANNNKNTKRVSNVLASILTLFLFTGCSHYKSSWSCRNPEGIGCSSIGYADRVARKDIILNDDKNFEPQSTVNQQGKNKNYKKLLIRERYSDFKKQNRVEVDFD
jgi:hypothetical protein